VEAEVSLLLLLLRGYVMCGRRMAEDSALDAEWSCPESRHSGVERVEALLVFVLVACGFAERCLSGGGSGPGRPSLEGSWVPQPLGP